MERTKESNMSKRVEFNIHEYISIREEMIQRISLINSQSHTAIITIITAFGAGITLNFDVQVNSTDNVVSFIALNIIRSLLFLIPIVYLMPLSVKSGENLIQIASISAYIRVFYEYFSRENILMNWETSNNILSNANIDRGKKSFIAKFYNEEYTVLGSISFTLFIIFSTVTIISIKPLVSINLLVVL